MMCRLHQPVELGWVYKFHTSPSQKNHGIGMIDSDMICRELHPNFCLEENLNFKTKAMEEKAFPAWSSSVEQCLKQYNVKLDKGLSSYEVEKRRETYGWNELAKEKESNAERALEALKEMQCESGKVLRDGYWVPELPARKLVPGDIVELRVGDKVPADMRVAALKTSTLRVEQSSLTGEAMPVFERPCSHIH
ncbi:hypothetical protein GH714_010281 [Hevea brasiliensis]|uniref:Uncharacterized protein n=1 Tax=Hevea brasiliensis TaxID=3981 RepID=A0A6A6MHV0_HEVBR|nr:hypothetical protein GH714_010281 [Hevea brasiliensis]